MEGSMSQAKRISVPWSLFSTQNCSARFEVANDNAVPRALLHSPEGCKYDRPFRRRIRILVRGTLSGVYELSHKL